MVSGRGMVSARGMVSVRVRVEFVLLHLALEIEYVLLLGLRVGLS